MLFFLSLFSATANRLRFSLLTVRRTPRQTVRVPLSDGRVRPARLSLMVCRPSTHPPLRHHREFSTAQGRTEVSGFSAYGYRPWALLWRDGMRPSEMALTDRQPEAVAASVAFSPSVVSISSEPD